MPKFRCKDCGRIIERSKLMFFLIKEFNISCKNCRGKFEDYREENKMPEKLPKKVEKILKDESDRNVTRFGNIKDNIKWKLNSEERLFLYGAGIAVLFIFLWMSFYIINAGERGVILTLGKPSMDSKLEGIHFKVPIIQTVKKMEVRTQKYEADLTAASKDLQDVNTKIAINYHIIPEKVPEIYRDLGMGYAEKIIYPYEQEANKGITAQFTAEELITKRESVREKMKGLLADKLRERGIIIEEISIVNFAFSEVFTKAIENKVTAEQLKLKADRDLERIKVEAEQKIASARAEAEALRLQKGQISPDLIQLRQIEVQRAAIDKWNGVMPLVTGGAMPLIDLKQFGEAKTA